MAFKAIKIVDVLALAVIAGIAAGPASAVAVAVPEPEVAGGVFAVGMLVAGYRALRKLAKR